MANDFLDNVKATVEATERALRGNVAAWNSDKSTPLPTTNGVLRRGADGVYRVEP